MYTLTTDLDTLALPYKWSGQETVLTIGAFDGIHTGHQGLIHKMIRQARQTDRLAGLLTFAPHPITVLRPQEPFYYLTTPRTKEALLETLGLDILVTLRFDLRLASMPPRAFVQRLREQIAMRELWIGPDFALGKKRAGDPAMLRELGRELGFEVHDVPYVAQGHGRVSSSSIRALILEGDVAQAARLLGRHYCVSGTVVEGAQRGRDLGFPTANVSVAPNRALPAHGVYATYAYLGSERHLSVTNVGVRPTFDHGACSVEAYLLDFSQDLYGRELALAFVERQRAELHFDDVQALIVQMERDVAQARQILECRNRVLCNSSLHIEQKTDFSKQSDV